MENYSPENIDGSEMATFQELFSVFDKKDTGKIPIKDFPVFLRGLGHCPTEMELGEIVRGFKSSSKNEVTFQDAVNSALKRKKQQTIEEELIEAFEGLNSEAGSHSEDGEKTYQMSATAAKKYLMEFGE